VEVVTAPAGTPDALAVFAGKPNVRVRVTDAQPGQADTWLDLKRVAGGGLVQAAALGRLAPEDLRLVRRRQPGEDEVRDVLFAWRVVRFVKSNAIVYARNECTIGIGAGQMSRVDSVRIAAAKARIAGLEIAGSVM